MMKTVNVLRRCLTDMARFGQLSFLAFLFSCYFGNVAFSQTPEPPGQSTANAPVASSNDAADADFDELRRISRDLYDRLEIQEKRLEIALQLKSEQLDSIYRLLELFAWASGLLVVYLAVRDFVQRRREVQRQERIDEIIAGMAGHQNKGLASVNEVIATVQETLKFRLQQEATVATALNWMDEIKVKFEEEEKEKDSRYNDLIAHSKDFSEISRMDFAVLPEEKRLEGLNLRRDANEMKSYLNTKTDFMEKGRLYYVCGVLSYYENDIQDAKRYLDLSAQMRGADHEGELRTNQDYRIRIAFTHYFRAIIEKNWGITHEALHEIDECIRVRPLKKRELLTPITRLEILSYEPGWENQCLEDMEHQTRIVEELAEEQELDANQVRLRNRLLLLLGNIKFITKNYAEALEQYERATSYDSRNYYSIASEAQCLEFLQRKSEAAAKFQQALSAIEETRDIERKREIVTRAVIIVLAVQSARGAGDKNAVSRYTQEARVLLGSKLSINGMEPRFFSPATKRLVGASDLFAECQI